MRWPWPPGTCEMEEPMRTSSVRSTGRRGKQRFWLSRTAPTILSVVPLRSSRWKYVYSSSWFDVFSIHLSVDTFKHHLVTHLFSWASFYCRIQLSYSVIAELLGSHGTDQNMEGRGTHGFLFCWRNIPKKKTNLCEWMKLWEGDFNNCDSTVASLHGVDLEPLQTR